MLALSVLVGALAGFSAAALEYSLHEGSSRLVGQFTHLGKSGVFDFRLALLILPTLGGLVAGLAVRRLSPDVEGHGTELLIRAFHRHGGNLPIRGPGVHVVGAVGVISCGGSAGPEGPIAALGAAIGSKLGDIFCLTARERRAMLVAGCGAGVGAIFQCPLGGALFAASVLYREPDYETDSITPALVASVIGYSTYMFFWGYGEHMLRDADELVFVEPQSLILFAILGPLCGVTCALLRFSLKWVEAIAVKFARLRWLAPAAGGLATGAIACVLPQVMDGQYRFIQHAMDGTFDGGFAAQSWWTWAALFGAVALMKCVATGFTVGSGAPGGVLGPSVFVGGALGAALGAVFMALAPDVLTSDPDNLRRALIPAGMAGVLSASMRVPLASLVMVIEMTGGYGLIVPLMLVCVTSYLVGGRWGLNDEQVPTSAESPAHAGDLIVRLLEASRVADLMHRDGYETVASHATFGELVQRLKPGVRPVLAVVDDNRFTGLISVEEIRQMMDIVGVDQAVIAADMVNTTVPRLRPDESAYTALTHMARSKHLALPVVRRDNHNAIVGLITRTEIHAVVREQINRMSQSLLSEHSGLAAMEQEEALHQLAAGAAVGKADRIQRLLVPMQVVGVSLREADFRRRFGVQVIAVEQPDGTIQSPPDVDAPLQTMQRLLVLAENGGTEAGGPQQPQSPS